MALGSLIDGAGQLDAAADLLEETWLAARTHWDDGVSRSLNEEHFEPLFAQVRMTIDAISRLNSVLMSACRECEDQR